MGAHKTICQQLYTLEVPRTRKYGVHTKQTLKVQGTLINGIFEQQRPAKPRRFKQRVARKALHDHGYCMWTKSEKKKLYTIFHGTILDCKK